MLRLALIQQLILMSNLVVKDIDKFENKQTLPGKIYSGRHKILI